MFETRIKKCFEVGCESTRPHASTVDSLGLDLRLTIMPSSSDHLGASRFGSSHRMSGNNALSLLLSSNSRIICLRNPLAIGRV